MHPSSVESMKFVVGSRPGWVHVSRPTGHPNAGDASNGVSSTWSPGGAHPPWNVWYSPSQCPISCVAVSPSLYGVAVPPGG